MYNLTPGKAKGIEKLKEETRQDNQDIAGQKKEQDEFFVGIGLGQGNKKLKLKAEQKHQSLMNLFSEMKILGGSRMMTIKMRNGRMIL